MIVVLDCDERSHVSLARRTAATRPPVPVIPPRRQPQVIERRPTGMSRKLTAMLRALGHQRGQFFEAFDCMRSAQQDGGASMIEVLTKYGGGDDALTDCIWQAASELSHGTITSGTRRHMQRSGMPLRRSFNTGNIVARRG